MIKLRVQGLPQDVHSFVVWMMGEDSVRILECSDQYRNRGSSEYVRCYVEIEQVKENPTREENDAPRTTVE